LHSTTSDIIKTLYIGLENIASHEILVLCCFNLVVQAVASSELLTLAFQMAHYLLLPISNYGHNEVFCTTQTQFFRLLPIPIVSLVTAIT